MIPLLKIQYYIKKLETLKHIRFIIIKIIVMILNRFISILILATLLSKEILSKQQQSQSDKQVRSRWNQTLKYITFQQTIMEFPQIRDNINAMRIAELIDAGGCKNDLQPLRILFMDNKVYFYGVFGNYQSRVESLKKFYTHLVTRANFPDTYFIIHFQDELLPQTVYTNSHKICRKLPLFMFNKNSSAEFEKTKFLLPDSEIINEKWQQEIQNIKQASQKIKWEDKKQKLFFRGLASGPHSYDMKIDQNMDFFKYFHRGAFLLLAIKYPNLIDAEYSRHKTVFIDETQRRMGDKPLVLAKQLNYEQQLKYKYILSADGFGAAWKRIPFILFSNSILFKPYSQKIQWFYDKLIPNTNFVEIKDDLSDLFNRMQQMNNNPQKAKNILKQANKIANKYLNRQQVISFTIQTLLKYAKYQNLSLTQQEKQKIRNGVDIQKVFLQKKLKEMALIGVIFIFIFVLLVGVLLFVLFFDKMNLISLSNKNKEIQQFSLKEISQND